MGDTEGFAMKMSVLLLLVTAIGMLVPSEAQAKRYRVDRTGRNSWTVTDEAELLDDPDRFAFGADPALLRKWGTDPKELCKPTPDGRGISWRDNGGVPAYSKLCAKNGDTWTSYRLIELRRELSDSIESGKAPRCDSATVQILERVVPRPPKALQARADLEKCLEIYREDLAAKIREWEVKCAAHDAAETDKNEKCKADLSARIQDRVEKAPTRPIAEILEIPNQYRLAEENARLADEKAKKITKGRRKPKPPKTSTQEASSAPLTNAEIRAMTKKQNAEGYEACSADAHRVIRKMIACGLDVGDVSVEWMCQKLNPTNITVLAATKGCQELRALLNM
jgi:hypothetical protein